MTRYKKFLMGCYIALWAAGFIAVFADVFVWRPDRSNYGINQPAQKHKK